MKSLPALNHAGHPNAVVHHQALDDDSAADSILATPPAGTVHILLGVDVPATALRADPELTWLDC